MISGSLLSSVESEFDRRHLNASHEWLKACVDWCVSEGLFDQNSVSFDVVYQQWLNTDITVHGVQKPNGGLPICCNLPDKTSIVKIQLPASTRFVLQVQFAIDIGHPVYGQWQSLMRVNETNSSVGTEPNFTCAWEPKPSRVLMFFLTDGTVSVRGVEREPINFIHELISPGLKLSIVGPLEFRRGVLMLKPCNVVVLGGHVDEVEEKFCKRKVFSSILGISDHENNTAPAVEADSVATNPVEINMADEDDALFSSIEMPTTNDLVSRQISSSMTSNLLPEGNIENNVDDLHFNNDFVAWNEMVNRSIPLNMPPSSAHIPPTKPFTYLAHRASSSMSNQNDSPIIICKCTIVTLASRLKIIEKPSSEGPGKIWHLQIVITDGTDTVMANVGWNLLEKWIGLNADSYVRSVRQNANHDKNVLKERVGSISHHLLTLNALFKIRLGGSEPYIEDVVELNAGHVQQLKLRIQRRCQT